MIHEELKKANVSAMKAGDKSAHSIYTLLLGRLNLSAKEKHIPYVDDTEASNMIKKLIKELEDEKNLFEKANRLDHVQELSTQINLINGYLPKQLTQKEIKEKIDLLEDKTIPSIMKYFKQNYNGLVDMKLVSEIAKNSK